VITVKPAANFNNLTPHFHYLTCERSTFIFVLSERCRRPVEKGKEKKGGKGEEKKGRRRFAQAQTLDSQLVFLSLALLLTQRSTRESSLGRKEEKKKKGEKKRKRRGKRVMGIRPEYAKYPR